MKELVNIFFSVIVIIDVGFVTLSLHFWGGFSFFSFFVLLNNCFGDNVCNNY